MIKKIVITNKDSYSIKLSNLSLITYVNGGWNTLGLGSTITSECNLYDTDTLRVSRNGSHSTGYIYFYFKNGDTIYTQEKVTIEFKTPVKVLSAIRCTVTNEYLAATIYDENDNIIHNVYPLESGSNLTPELKKIKVYPTNTVGTIVTNDTSHISDVYSISQVTTDETTEDAITDIKYAVSFDGRKTYKAYKNSAWSALSLSNIMTNGMSKAELEALTDSEYDPQLTSDRTFDIVAGMNTNNSEKTPSIKFITVDYLKISNT